MNKKIKIGICFCGCIFVLLVIAGMLVFFFLFKNKSREVTQEKKNYEEVYNYDALTEPPWVYSQEDIEKFNTIKEDLENNGYQIDGEFYKEIMEADVEGIYNEAISGAQENDTENDNDSQDSTVFVNQYYGFSFDTGKYHDDIYEIYESPDWAVDSITYCYWVNDNSFSDEICEKGSVNIFSIMIFDSAQYQIEVIDSPYADIYSNLGEKEGLYYVFSHPNGELPADAPSTVDFYDRILETFEFVS